MSTKASIWDYTTASGIFIVVYHVALLIGLPFYFYYTPPTWGLVAACVVALFLTELGIGAAYHRFYSHRAFKLSKPVEAVLLFLATVATQGSALRWSFEHRLHHAYVDTDRDPYSIKKGFWYAHMLWLFDPPQDIDPRRVPDLLANKLAMFQHRHFALLSTLSNVLIWLGLGFVFKDYLGAFVLGWWTRLAISHHLTWFINSLAHYWGERTYSQEHSAVDNFVIAFLTVGEGYHNYHHTFAADYRNGVRWYHFDPVKWTVFTLSKLGLASNLRRYSKYTIQRRLVAEDRKLLLGELKQRQSDRMAELERRVLELSNAIQEKLERMRRLVGEIQQLKSSSAEKVKAARAELKALRRSLRIDWKSWAQLGDTILAPAPA